MNPSVQDRLGSAVRALGNVILPALPEDAGFAREQTMLVMGHLQIIAAQFGATPGFENEEADDLHRMARAVLAASDGGDRTELASAALSAAIDHCTGKTAQDRTRDLQNGIDALLVALARDGDAQATTTVRRLVLEQGSARAEKDRRWFAAMGFDAEYSLA